MSSVKNYTDQGGDKTVIGGELHICKGAKFTLEQGVDVHMDDAPAPSGPFVVDKQGHMRVSQIAYQADCKAATSVQKDFNALLAKLREAGLMASE